MPTHLSHRISTGMDDDVVDVVDREGVSLLTDDLDSFIGEKVEQDLIVFVWQGNVERDPRLIPDDMERLHGGVMAGARGEEVATHGQTGGCCGAAEALCFPHPSAPGAKHVEDQEAGEGDQCDGYENYGFHRVSL
jgi:hypothetical protein